MKAQLKTVEQVLEEGDRRLEGLELLRQPFKPHQISKLPKETRGQIDARKENKNLMVWKCPVCGGAHHKDAVHLDYVGHAALTDRLLDCDPNWSWEPMGTTPEGLPAIQGGLWIKLTVCGVSRYGFGAADGKSGGDAVKEMIGDALRNAAMRFGAALDLWHKGDLHLDNDDSVRAEVSPSSARPTTGETPPRKPEKLDGPYSCRTKLMTASREFVRTLNSMGDLAEFVAWSKTDDVKEFVAQLKRDMPDWWHGGESVPADFVPLEILVSQKKRDLEAIETEMAK